jgi:HD-GYP domain-containing protein (c-di-GMP phosphodiesterase class II)
MDFLEALSLQASIAIENAAMFNNLHRSNIDLSLAYNATLEGWARALDMRDKVTEGHSQRVALATTQIGRAMGMRDEELVHVYRGALLHDIGKLCIPDSILFKPGPLSDEEWKVMRRHPADAYALLSTIPYLRLALDIPYCHHEKWDGTGYPNRLKGEEIPLSARIFSVVDVWDALRSERPYRAALPHDEVLRHVRSLASIHFDPRVVVAFLDSGVGNTSI